MQKSLFYTNLSLKLDYDMYPVMVQPSISDYKRLLNKPYENEVNLTWQNQPLKHCWSLEILTQIERDLDLSILKTWGL